MIVIKKDVDSPSEQTILELAARLTEAAVRWAGPTETDDQMKTLAKWATNLAGGLTLEAERTAQALYEIKYGAAVSEAVVEAAAKIEAEAAVEAQPEPEQETGDADDK